MCIAMRRIIFILFLALGAAGAAFNMRAAEPDYSMLANVDFTNYEQLAPWLTALDEEDEEESIVADLLREAANYTGVVYRRGGKTPTGFDCSGFTSYVFRQFGYTLSPSSRGQYTEGDAVATEDIMPGDLVFFKGRRSGQVGHVGIAIEHNTVTGVTTFIHAAVKGGIRVDTTDQPYYKQRFLGARRVM